MQYAEFRGSRGYTDANAAAQEAAGRFNGLPQGLTRLGLLSLVKRNRAWIGLTRGQTNHLQFLILRTWDQDWEAGERPVVWLSVNSTARQRDLSERQVQRHERALNDAGALTWNDSGNHRRYGWRNGDGRIVEARGVDLSPLGAMAPELLTADRRRRAEDAAWDRERRCASALKRSVRAMLASAVREGLADFDSGEWHSKTAVLDGNIRAGTALAALRGISARLQLLGDALRTLLQRRETRGRACGKTVKTSPWGDRNVAHIDITNHQTTDKSVTSTSGEGTSTARGGKTDAPCGAESSFESVDGRGKWGGGAELGGGNAGNGRTTARRGRGWRQAGAVAGSLGEGVQTPMSSGPGKNRLGGGGTNRGGGHGSSNGDYAGSGERSRDGMGRERGDARDEVRSRQGSAASHAAAGDRPKGGLWKPDTGVRHLSVVNVEEAAGPRFLDCLPETEQPDWGAIGDAAEKLCPELGIAPQAWWVAVTVMGRRAAAVCVMLIDRKMCPDAEDPVRCPGAYLRGMTASARDDDLHLHASVFGSARRAAA